MRQRSRINAITNGLRLYGSILLQLKSPAQIIWQVFGESKGRIPIFGRDLLCDWKTVQELRPTGRSTDETTVAFEPFVPLFKLNDNGWRKRRIALKRAFEPQYVSRLAGPYEAPDLSGDVVDLHERVFETCFKRGFTYVFGRPPSIIEQGAMLPGMHDLNRYVKRQVLVIDLEARRRCYDAVRAAIADPPEGFIFKADPIFLGLDEDDQVSLVGSDLLFSCSVQPADMVCHLLLLQDRFPDQFAAADLDDCINESLRLYPLSDIYARVPYNGERAWLASLIQLNRNGWDRPDDFLPDRWKGDGHPPNMAWGVEARACPGKGVGLTMTREMFRAIMRSEDLLLVFPSDFIHERTFPLGLPVRVIKRGATPQPFRRSGRLRRQIVRWVVERKRMVEQGEVW